MGTKQDGSDTAGKTSTRKRGKDKKRGTLIEMMQQLTANEDSEMRKAYRIDMVQSDSS